MNSVLGAAPPVPLRGRFPVAILQFIFLKEGLSAQADRRPEAISPDFNRWATGHEICVRLLEHRLDILPNDEPSRLTLRLKHRAHTDALMNAMDGFTEQRSDA